MGIPGIMKTIFFILLLIAASVAVVAEDFEAERQRAVTTCMQIDADAYQSNLWLNPAGYRGYYERSRCLQQAAIEFRDRDICNDVKELFALLSSTWGYSESNCRKLVEEKLVNDKQALQDLKRRYMDGPVRLLSIRIEQNGNGRDYDIIPSFSDGWSTGYHLTIAVVDGSRVVPVLNHGGYVEGAGTRLRLYLPRRDLVARFADVEFNRSYPLRVMMTLSIGTRKADGWLRQDVIDEVFPLPERQQVLEATAVFQ